MKVLHVLSGLHVGGIESLAFQLINFLPDSIENELLNIDSTACQMQSSFEQLKTSHKLTELHNWEPVDGIKLALQSYHLCIERRPSSLLIYPFNRLSLLVALGAFASGSTKIFVHLGNTAPIRLTEKIKWILLIFLFKLIGASLIPASKAIILSFKPLPVGYFFPTTIPNACDTVSIAEQAQLARLKRPPDDFCRIIMVARLDNIKDHETLLRAYALLSPPRWQLHFVGDGPERCKLEKLCRELGLNSSTIFRGLQRNIPQLLGTSDVFAFSTSSLEGFGIALIEALSAGMPIIASDVPACREVLENGKAGFLVPSRDVSAWSIALEKFIYSKPTREYYQRMACLHSKRYDTHVVALRWQEHLSS